eukprot:2170844-Ditylum_brightwellii.AAC.1
MLHALLRYAEVFTYISFISVPSLPLELCPVTDRRRKTEVKDGANIGVASNVIHQRLALEYWHQHTNAEKLLLQNNVETSFSVDKISQFSARLPEFCYIFDNVEQYYRWFEIKDGTVSADNMMVELNPDILYTFWIYGLQQRINF